MNVGGRLLLDSQAPGDGVFSSYADEREALDRVTRAIGDLMGSEFARLTLRYSKVGPVSRAVLSAVRHDDSTTSFSWFGDVSDAIEKLRPMMFRPGSGTWFSARVEVTSEGRVDATFNYDDVPWGDDLFAPDAYAHDLASFPRDDAHIPDWLRTILAQA
jgi:hypothetical protein